MKTMPLLLLLLALAGCATQAPTLAPQRIAEIVGAADRTPADRTNDQRRQPEKMQQSPPLRRIDRLDRGPHRLDSLTLIQRYYQS